MKKFKQKLKRVVKDILFRELKRQQHLAMKRLVLSIVSKPLRGI